MGRGGLGMLPLLAACAVSLAAAGCGYSFSGTSMPGHIRTIAVPVPANETLDGLIAGEVSRGLSERFLEDNRLKVVSEGTADCVLVGRVTGYERRVHSYTAGQEPEDYIVILRLALVLQDRVKNRDLWSADRLEATATYPADGIVPAGSTDPADERAAREAAIAKLAQDVIARTLEQW